MDSNQRKLLNTLSISGIALIAFCILDVVKFVMYWFLAPTQMELLSLLFQDQPQLRQAFWVFVVGYLLIEILLCFFIGLFARSEGNGKKRSIFYIIVACFLAIYLLASGVLTIVYCFLGAITAESVIDSFISALVDFSVIFVLFEIITCSLKLRKQNKEGGQK